jgi:molecular chaperone GrpE
MEKKEDKMVKRGRIAQLEAEIKELREGWQRTQADFINYRKRVEEERQEWSRLAELKILLEFLTIFDNLERAFCHLKEGTKKEILARKELENWFRGVEFVKKQFLEKLKSFGLERIETKGLKFDPKTMEAVSMAEGPTDQVTAETESGWLYKGRVIRPAKVIVGKGGSDF